MAACLLAGLFLTASCGGKIVGDSPPVSNPATGQVTSPTGQQDLQTRTPATSGAGLGLAINETVQHGEVWVLLRDVPAETQERWRVGLTDSAGRDFVLGKPSSEKDPPSYPLPDGVAPGDGKVWLSAGDSPAVAGTLEVPIHIQKAYESYEIKRLSVCFAVPRGWRLYDGGEPIVLERTWQRAAQPVEVILIKRFDPKEDIPQDARTEKVVKMTVAGKPATQIWMIRETARKTASWREIHTVVDGVDIIFQYRLWTASPEADAAYAKILETLTAQPQGN